MRIRTERVVVAGDGTHLYARETRGPDATGLPMICSNGIGVSTFFWRYLEEEFSHERPVILWDYRGHGQSEWPRDLDDLTIEAMADDLQRVLAAFDHERAIALGHSMGCQVIYTFANRYPQSAAMLVPMLGTSGRPVHTFLGLHEVFPLAAFLVSHTVATRLPDAIARVERKVLTSPLGRRWVSKLARVSGLCHPTLMRQEDLENYLDHFGHFSPLVFFRMAENMATHDAGVFLDQLEAPTLVVAGKNDIFTPMKLSQRAAEVIPTARLFVLEEGSHAGLVEEPARIHAEIRDFMREHAIEAEEEPPEASEARVA